MRELIGFVTILIVCFAASAFAAEAPAQPPAKKEAAAQQPSKPRPKVEVKCTLTGLLGSKTVKNKQGKDVHMLRIEVAEAKTADGKALDGLKGKNVAVARKKGLPLDASVGKTVSISGTLSNNRRMVPDSIK